MNRFWELIVYSRGRDRFYCMPFLFLFALLTPIYQLVSRIHLRRRKKRCSREWAARVISVGNIAVGGSGKTPLVIWLAEKLIEAGKKVAIVHSGYGRRDNKDIVIDYGHAEDYAVRKIGDETAMMSLKLPQAGFAIGRDKKKMVKLADRELGPDVIIIDDGFQRLDIEKDLDIVALNGQLFEQVFDKSRHPVSKKDLKRSRLSLFPFGILRESPEQLKRADAIFRIGFEDKPQTGSVPIDYDKKQLPVLEWTLSLSTAVKDGQVIAFEELKSIKPFIFVGIGSFDRMLAMLESKGVAAAGSYNFGDHYLYDKSDLAHLWTLSDDAGADCYLTTEKDMVKLSHLSFDKPLYCLQLDISPSKMERVEKLLGRVL